VLEAMAAAPLSAARENWLPTIIRSPLRLGQVLGTPPNSIADEGELSDRAK
jgi:hypothetical protein